jgi:hypothetical protein
MINLLLGWIMMFCSFFHPIEKIDPSWSYLTQWDTVYGDHQELSVEWLANVTSKPNTAQLKIRFNQLLYQDSLTCTQFDLVAYDNYPRAQLVDVDEDGTLDWVYLYVVDCQSGSMASKKYLLYGNHKYLTPIKISGYGLDPATPWLLETHELLLEASDMEEYLFPGKIERNNVFLNRSEIEKNNLMQLWQEDLAREYSIFSEEK